MERRSQGNLANEPGLLSCSPGLDPWAVHPWATWGKAPCVGLPEEGAPARHLVWKEAHIRERRSPARDSGAQGPAIGSMGWVGEPKRLGTHPWDGSCRQDLSCSCNRLGGFFNLTPFRGRGSMSEVGSPSPSLQVPSPQLVPDIWKQQAFQLKRHLFQEAFQAHLL